MLAELMRLKYGIAIAARTARRPPPPWWRRYSARRVSTPRWWWRRVTASHNARLGRGSSSWRRRMNPTDRSSSSRRPSRGHDHRCRAPRLLRGPRHDSGGLSRLREQVPFYGSAVLCLDQPNIQQLIPSIEKRVITYGIESGAEVTARRLTFSGMQSQFEVLNRARTSARSAYRSRVATTCSTPRRRRRGPRPRGAVREDPAGPRRLRGRPAPLPGQGGGGGVLVVDDYGHHPAEIRATLAAAKAGSIAA